MTYGNIQDWRAYALARGNSAPGGVDDIEAEASLLRASDYIRTRYLLPLGLDDDDPNVIEATYIAATYDLETPNFWSRVFTASTEKVLTEVKGIKWQVIESGFSGANRHLPMSPAIEALFIGSRAYGSGIYVV